ncbi:tetratricopeptide repeat protein [uncultured Oxalicibacterium sp.]|uniref:tetratricopeptide repeat protein n=1 Tax=uncultured Oxalicibacterium sp. TaxID=1168540 RepID=UPI0025E393C4|nr:tetratricopeptide repeat protein [uncultured Oxalicibacterium sp.]
MAYDHAEQEQLAGLKSWWERYGNLATWLLIIALAAFAAWKGWTYYQTRQAAQAAQLYEELQGAITAKDKEKIARVSSDMQSRFSGTAYAQMTGLAAAKSAFDAGDFQTAKTQLQWVADKGRNEEYKAIARIRLSGILLDEKAYDEALKVLSGKFPAEFAGLVEDRKGDIFVAQNKLDEARVAYQAAMEKTDARSAGRQLIQIKLDAIGGAPAAKAA